MGLDAKQLRDYIVRPTLELLNLPHIDSAERLIMGTGAQESAGFKYIHQLGKGPALGLWQMEPATFNDLWKRFVVSSRYERKIGIHIEFLVADSGTSLEEQLIWNLRFACAMCRVHYYARKFSFTGRETVVDLAHIWKKHYNTIEGKGTAEEFIKNWNRYLGELY
jgi:hypothetical protein